MGPVVLELEVVDPVAALSLGLGVLAVAVLVFWPGRGLVARWGRSLGASERVRMEDALKHLYDCESRGLPCTLLSLAGSLRLRHERSAGLLTRLLEMGLVERRGEGYVLTSSGRGEALRVVRLHRLWERYLAEETGVAAADWHRIADRREHTTSESEAAALAAATGHPRYDPHGDPIPTVDGEVVPPLGRPLTDLATGEVAEIVHVEDEPEAVYAQILAAGLELGMRVRVLETTPSRLRIEADGDEHVLAPLVAANLSVAPLETTEADEGPSEPLTALSPGEKATVIGLSAGLRGAERRRMLDLGLLPGTAVAAELRAPGGDPTGYRIRGAVIALRREQAMHVRVSRAPVEEGRS